MCKAGYWQKERDSGRIEWEGVHYLVGWVKEITRVCRCVCVVWAPSATFSPWPMGCTSWQFPMTHGSYICCTMLWTTHEAWVVQYRERMVFPWIMGCTTHILTMFFPWPMGHTTLYNRAGVYVSHATWVVQHSYPPWPMGCTTAIPSMPHELYNNPSTHGPWIIQCLYYLCSIEYILKFIQPQHNLI